MTSNLAGIMYRIIETSKPRAVEHPSPENTARAMGTNTNTARNRMPRECLQHALVEVKMMLDHEDLGKSNTRTPCENL